MPTRPLAKTNLGGGTRSRRRRFAKTKKNTKLVRAVKSIMQKTKEMHYAQVYDNEDLLTAYRWTTDADAEWLIKDLKPSITDATDPYNRLGNKIMLKGMDITLLYSALNGTAVDNLLIRTIVLCTKEALSDMQNLIPKDAGADDSHLLYHIYQMNTGLVKKIYINSFCILNRPDTDVYSSGGCNKLIKKYCKCNHVVQFQPDMDSSWNSPYFYYLCVAVKKLNEAVAGDVANCVRMSYDVKWTFKCNE